MTKEKIYKNPERGNDKPPQPYKPQWKVWGREPVIAGNSSSPNINQSFVPQSTFPKNIGNNVPFAESTVPTFDDGKLPNVGNNVENTWAGIDSISIEEDVETEMQDNHPMIDNNDFIEIPKNNSPILDRFNKIGKLFNQVEQKKTSKIEEILSSLNNNDYILLVQGNVFAIGSLTNIQEEVRKLIFEENYSSMNDLVVLKNVQIKVGVFLE